MRLAPILIVLAACDCGGASNPDSGLGDAAIDGTLDGDRTDAGPLAPRGAIAFHASTPGLFDHGQLTSLPAGFGEAEFTFQLWIRPDHTFPVGPTDGAEQLQNWSDADPRPYTTADWWYRGNFLLDGFNSAGGFERGSFALQFYGGGRLRWLLGDGTQLAALGGVWSTGIHPASTTRGIVDGRWHSITVLRRFANPGSADLELWIDGGAVASELTFARTDMRTYWDTWPGFGAGSEGWFFGAEKQAAVGTLPQYEDYKGLVSEMRFWSVALTPAQLGAGRGVGVRGSEPGLVGWFPFDEGSGTRACDALDRTRCIVFTDTDATLWSADAPPLR